MKINILIFIIASILFPLNVIGEEIKINKEFQMPTLKDAALNPEYKSFFSDDMLFGTNEGSPNLPFKYVRLIIPSNSEAESVILNKYEMQRINLSGKIEPAQSPVRTGRPDENIKYVDANEAIYSSDAAFPTNMAEIVDVRDFGGNKVVIIKVYPFQYYPKSNVLEFYKNLEISLLCKTSKDNSRKSTPSIVDHQILYDLVDNKDDIDKFSINSSTSEPIVSTRGAQNGLGYEYVIITNEALVPAFERFANWKRRKGMTVGIITIEYIKAQYSGDLTSGIYDIPGKVRQFLKNSYAAGTRYVLIGGDENIVPARYACVNENNDTYDYKIPTDYYYSELNGNWNYDGDQYYGEYQGDKVTFDQQLYVGRLLCSTKEHVNNWTYKVFLYEKNPGRGDFPYLRKLFFTQADQLQQGSWDNHVYPKMNSIFTTKTVFNEKLNGVDNPNSPQLPQFPSGTNVMNELNNNYGLVSFMGHGCPTDVAIATVGLNNNSYPKLRIYTYDNIKQDIHGVNEYSNGGSLKNMANDGYPNINYSVSCDNIPYDKLSPWPEDRVDDSFGEVLTSIYRTGSVAFLGNTRSGWIDNSKYLFGYFADAIRNGNLSLGKAEAISKTYLTTSNFYDRFLVFTHNLIGCPEMKMWTTTPSKFTSASILRSGNTVTVNANVSGSKICVMSSTDNGASYYQVINSTTQYSFANVPVSYTVTITKDNYIPYIYASDLTIQNQTYNSGDYFFNAGNITLNNVTINGTTSFHLEPLGYVTMTSGTLSISNNAIFSIE